MNIPLGYEIKSGFLVAIPLRHTAVIGLTQESGKTTTLEGLITRAGNARALAFVTKRGEGSFHIGRIVPPYFQEPAQDGSQPLWQYVSSLLETTLGGEKLRVQRSSIMRVCDACHTKGARWDRPTTLRQVAANIETALATTRNGFVQDMYLQLREYFRIVTPQIEALPRSTALTLEKGLNVMVLDDLPQQMQGLIMASCLNWIRTRERNTITIIPEGWKFLGEGRASPAIAAGEQLIREGGVLGNFLWIDSQDVVGIAPQIRKSIGVWILGRQSEPIEAERVVKHLPGDIAKPKPGDIQQLRKGVFYVSWGERLRKCYVQPAWLDASTAQLVAMTDSPAPAKPKSADGDDEMWREMAEQKEAENKVLETKLSGLLAEFDKQTAIIQALGAQIKAQGRATELHAPLCFPTPQEQSPTPSLNPAEMEEADFWLAKVWPLVRDSVAKDPAILRVLTNASEIAVVTKPKRIDIDGDTLRGRLALMIKDGLFDKPTKFADCADYLQARGCNPGNANINKELGALVKLGFLVKQGNTFAMTYTRAAGIKITERQLEAS